MMFGFEVNKEKELVTVIFGGSLSSEEREKVLEQLVEFLKNNPNLNIMLDVSRADLNMSDDEQIEYGHLLATKKQYFNKNKTAVVTNCKNIHSSLFLSEAYSEGFNNLMEFDNKSEALQWIAGEIK